MDIYDAILYYHFMSTLCDQSVCSSEDCNAHTLIIQQGATEHYPFVFHHGNMVEIEATQPGSQAGITTKYPHCFAPGDIIHIIHQDSSMCNTSTGGCATVTSVSDDYNFTASGVNTTAPGGSNGYVVRAMDLTGIRLCGGVRTRPVNQLISTSGLRGSGFQGSNELLIDGTCDVNLGDIINISNIGLIDAKVLGVFKKNNDMPNTNTVTSSMGSAGCGCSLKPISSSANIGGTCDSVLVILDKPIPQQIINQTGIDIQGSKLFDMNFTYHNDDPRCGIIHSRITGLSTRNIPVQTIPGACPDQAYKIGMFSICLKRGYGNIVPAHYPQADYDDQVINIRTGEVYLVPSYC